MMGWWMLIACALFAAALFAVLRFPRRQWMIAATALTLGATGYAWQGRPELAGHPVDVAAEEKSEIDPQLIAIREAVFGRFNLEDGYFRVSDAMARGSSKDTAARTMQGAVIKRPKDGALWTWYGITLVNASGGMLTPSAQLAFEKGIALWPKHPGPAYFYALALANTDPVKARVWLAKAVELTPPTQDYRAQMEGELTALDKFLAEKGAAAPAAPDEPKQ